MEMMLQVPHVRHPHQHAAGVPEVRGCARAGNQCVAEVR